MVKVILKGSFMMVRALVVIGNVALLIDGYGNKLGLNLEKEEDEEEVGGLEECGIVSVAVSEDGKILALVHESKCVFKLVGSGDETTGEVCYGDRMQAVGGVFLKEFDGLLIWSRDGFGIVYSIVSSSHDDGFKFELLFDIPGLNSEFDERSVVWFCQFGSRLVKLESLCLESSGCLLWKPYISIWSIPVDSSSHGSSKLLGIGGYSNEETRRMHKAKCSKNGVMSDMHIISCSMVLSEDSYVPYGVIYGFYNGDIEVIRFISHVPSTQKQHLEQRFLGHKGAVICLAAHCVIRDLVGQSVLRVLISGSTDCTVRIWDLDSGNVLSVLHHHVSTVKQIILPQLGSDHPWNNCFLTVGEDFCVALVSLENLRVERMFPGHIIYPSLVAWDSKRGYLSCLCQNVSSSSSSSNSVLYIWDVKSGARERIIRGTASHSMFDNLCKGLNLNSGSTSASSLPIPFVDGLDMTQTIHINNKGGSSLQSENTATQHALKHDKGHPVKFSCPFPGIATLEFDLFSLMSIHSEHHDVTNDVSIEEHLLRFSLCFLHLWDVDEKLDSMLVKEMGVCKPSDFRLGTGVVGDRGALTLTLPCLRATLELWKSSSEYCAMRSLVIVSLTQRMISLSHSSTSASSALAAFYTRNFAEKVPYIKPPLLQLLVSFWQDPSEHVRMAARSLFHCAAPHAIPYPLACQKTNHLEVPDKENFSVNVDSDIRKSSIVDWIESSDTNEWISWIDGTNQEAMASHIIVAAALVVWYPSIVKADLANLVVNQLVKLVMSMNDGYSSTAAELLSEGMESTWKLCLGHEIPHLINDVFFQIECLLGTSNTTSRGKPLSSVMQEALIEILLPSLAMADIAGFLNVIESQIWATSSDSPVHLVSLKTIIRVVRGATKPLAPFLDKVVNYILQTIDPGNLVMRKLCLKSSMTTLKEITRSFPMVGMDESSTRLAVGDPIGDIRSISIRIYDIESVTKVKVLDASGPLGLPNFIEGSTRTKMATAISALSFSPDGEGLVAFSENGLMIRWWPLGISWWEKISRNLVPVQCAKLIFVPPWEGFSPNSSRSSIMANIFGNSNRSNSQESPRESDNAENLKILLHNLDLSYRLQWVGGRSVQLTRHGQDLGTFPL